MSRLILSDLINAVCEVTDHALRARIAQAIADVTATTNECGMAERAGRAEAVCGFMRQIQREATALCERVEL
jgi:hypothetical protein